MDVPDLARERLGDEPAVGGVDLDGDMVLVTPTRTIVYRAEGILSDESVAEFPHDAERIELREGRRKTTVRYVYVEGTRDFSVPTGRADDLLAPLLWGVLYVAGVIGADETVRGAYRFSELTFVVTDARAAKHVGSALWDDEFDQFPYADLTDLDVEEGNVATAVVIEVAGRRERVKLPTDRAKLVRRTLEEAVFEYHDVNSTDEFRAAVAPDDDDEDDAEADAADGDAGIAGFETDGFEPLVEEVRDPPADAETDQTAGDAGGADPEAGGTDSRTTPSGEREEPPETGGEGPVVEQLTALTEAVHRQNELLEEQHETVERLVEELQRER